MSGLNLQQGCVNLPEFPVHMLGGCEGEVVCGIDGWYVGLLGGRRELMPGNCIDHSSLKGIV